MTFKSKRHCSYTFEIQRNFPAKIHSTSCNTAKMIAKSKKKPQKGHEG